MKKQEIYQQLSQYYDNNQITELLLKETGFTKNQLFLCKEIEKINQELLNNQVDLARSGFPFEYIIQKAEFYWCEFYVDERTLIPRNDTEIMVDCVLKLISLIIPPSSDTPFGKGRNKWITLIDIWTWSSCIPISILNNTDKISNTFVVDISKDALAVSKINIVTHNLEKLISQHLWSLLDPISGKLTWNVIITANLPYILDEDFHNMDKETVKYEPNTALYWWPVTWFELYEQLIQQCLDLKKSWNINTIDLFIEIWFDQKEFSQNYLNNIWLKNIYYKDHWWIERCIHILV
jgi:release factor glutamine methyltransferase